MIQANVTETMRGEWRAQVVLQRIDERCSLLELFPFAGRVRAEISPRVRSLVVGPNVVFYTYDEVSSEVRILRVIDGRRDLRAVFDDGGLGQSKFSPLILEMPVHVRVAIKNELAHIAQSQFLPDGRDEATYVELRPLHATRSEERSLEPIWPGWSVPDSFFEPLPDEILDAFESYSLGRCCARLTGVNT